MEDTRRFTSRILTQHLWSLGHRGFTTTQLPNGLINVTLRNGNEFNGRSIGGLINRIRN